METVRDFIFLGSKITAEGDCSHEIKRHLLLGGKSMTNLDSTLKSRDITLPTKLWFFQDSCIDVRVGPDRSWASMNWCFWTLVWEKTLENPLDCKEIREGYPKDNQSWIFIGRTDAEAPILWPLDMKSQFTGKDLDAGKDWGQDEKGMTENEVVGWHHWLNGHEFEQILEDSEGQGSLVCCSSWSFKELDMT